MNSDDELKMLQTLVDYLQQRITELKAAQKPVEPVPAGSTSQDYGDFGVFLSQIKSLPWQKGRKEGNEFVQSSKVPQEVKMYVMSKGKKQTGGFTLWTKYEKFFLSDSGIFGKDKREEKKSGQ